MVFARKKSDWNILKYNSIVYSVFFNAKIIYLNLLNYNTFTLLLCLIWKNLKTSTIEFLYTFSHPVAGYPMANTLFVIYLILNSIFTLNRGQILRFETSFFFLILNVLKLMPYKHLYSYFLLNRYLNYQQNFDSLKFLKLDNDYCIIY